MQATRLPRTGKKVTLAPLVDEYVRVRTVRGEFNHRTARGQRYMLHDFATHFGGRALNRLTIDVVDDWFEGMGVIAPATRRVRRSALVLFCRWLQRTKRIKVDPMVEYPTVRMPRTVPVTLPMHDVGTLLDLHDDDSRTTAILQLMVGMGCRCIEVHNLDLDDYDPRAGTLRIVGKFGHHRLLPVIDSVSKALDAYLDDVGRVSGPLIRGRKPGYSGESTYKRLHEKTLSRYASRWMAAAGVKGHKWDGKSAHGLRRTAASDVMDRTRDIELVQKMLGHARIETTTAYVRPSSLELLREGMEGRNYTMRETS